MTKLLDELLLIDDDDELLMLELLLLDEDETLDELLTAERLELLLLELLLSSNVNGYGGTPIRNQGFRYLSKYKNTG